MFTASCEPDRLSPIRFRFFFLLSRWTCAYGCAPSYLAPACCAACAVSTWTRRDVNLQMVTLDLRGAIRGAGTRVLLEFNWSRFLSRAIGIVIYLIGQLVQLLAT